MKIPSIGVCALSPWDRCRQRIDHFVRRIGELVRLLFQRIASFFHPKEKEIAPTLSWEELLIADESDGTISVKQSREFLRRIQELLISAPSFKNLSEESIEECLDEKMGFEDGMKWLIPLMRQVKRAGGWTALVSQKERQCLVDIYGWLLLQRRLSQLSFAENLTHLLDCEELKPLGSMLRTTVTTDLINDLEYLATEFQKEEFILMEKWMQLWHKKRYAASSSLKLVELFDKTSSLASVFCQADISHWPELATATSFFKRFQVYLLGKIDAIETAMAKTISLAKEHFLTLDEYLFIKDYSVKNNTDIEQRIMAFSENYTHFPKNNDPIVGFVSILKECIRQQRYAKNGHAFIRRLKYPLIYVLSKLIHISHDHANVTLYCQETDTFTAYGISLEHYVRLISKKYAFFMDYFKINTAKLAESLPEEKKVKFAELFDKKFKELLTLPNKIAFPSNRSLFKRTLRAINPCGRGDAVGDKTQMICSEFIARCIVDATRDAFIELNEPEPTLSYFGLKVSDTLETLITPQLKDKFCRRGILIPAFTIDRFVNWQ